MRGLHPLSVCGGSGDPFRQVVRVGRADGRDREGRRRRPKPEDETTATNGVSGICVVRGYQVGILGLRQNVAVSAISRYELCAFMPAANDVVGAIPFVDISALFASWFALYRTSVANITITSRRRLTIKRNSYGV